MKITFTDTSGKNLKQPLPALNFIPEWYKNTESYFNKEKKPDGKGQGTGTIKRCMPVFDAITAGYIITLPADVYVSLKDNEQYFEWADLGLVSFHDKIQAPEHPLKNRHTYPKWNNHWAIKTPKGYSTLFVQPMHREAVFSILPGIVDTDTYYAPVNFPMVINNPEFEGLIPAGTPIAQVIPFKRDVWQTEIGGQKDLNDILKLNNKLITKFFDKYKTMFRATKEYK